ncbi:MAG: hypothetical protein ABI550_03265 [Ignavibacteriaceae bacterium]
MKKSVVILLMLFAFSFLSSSYAQESPNGKKFGFGIIVGDPTGLSLKVWTRNTNAFAFSLGNSYFGKLRIGGDYLWHFNAFDSHIANLYAGPGGVIGIGEGNGFYYKDKYKRAGNDLGLGIRGVFGVNILPERTPLEIFFEIGVLVALTPDFGSSVDVAIGMRFYP